jgi:hypothetical protein
MPRYLEFLADAEAAPLLPTHNWQTIAAHAKREAMAIDNLDTFIKRWGRPDKPEALRKLEANIRQSPLTYVRALFLREQFMSSPANALPGQGPARIRSIEMGQLAMKKAGLVPTLPDPARLPPFSATLSLRFRLLTPLLTRDDDPFHLFDNPVRRDHIFGLPYLAAASVKGLSADAYQRAFLAEGEWHGLGDDAQGRIAAFRRRDGHALRLFGLADDGADTSNSQAGRLHLSPVWFDAVQYLVLNPSDPATGQGTIPIQFEAIAPRTTNDKPVEAEVQVFYANRPGAPDSDETTVRADLARWLAAVAAWWPTLGLGAKRLAGYGAIEPVAATCSAHGWNGWTAPRTERGVKSWMTLAEQIAQGA